MDWESWKSEKTRVQSETKSIGGTALGVAYDPLYR